MKLKLVYVHGHGASADSFNFIHSELASLGYDHDSLSYDSKNGFETNLKDMVGHLDDEQNIFFIAHSLGGLYALHLANILGEQVVGAVTMATPYGGSESALPLNFFFPQQLYKDIHPGARPITKGKQILLRPECHWTAIITTHGHSQMMSAVNDGVVTRDSMTRKNMNLVEVESNHHEVVQSKSSVAVIREALFRTRLSTVDSHIAVDCEEEVVA